jgi:hypothetical protein
MKTDKTPFSLGLASGLSIATVAIALTFGVPTVRADSEITLASLHELVVAPIMSAFLAAEARLSGLEATMEQLAGSFSSQQATAKELCVADEAGAQTCITKAQLDALLGVMMRQAAAAPEAKEAKEANATAPVVPANETPVAVEKLVAEPNAIETAANAEGATTATEPTAVATTPSEPASLATVAVESPAKIQSRIPAEPVAAENVQDDDLITTGSIKSDSLRTAISGPALVSQPEVGSSIAEGAPPVE